jgi:hypothetical protein
MVSTGVSRGCSPFAADTSAGGVPLKVPLAEHLMLPVRTDAAHPRHAPEHDQRDHRPHQNLRESGLTDQHGTANRYARKDLQPIFDADPVTSKSALLIDNLRFLRQEFEEPAIILHVNRSMNHHLFQRVFRAAMCRLRHENRLLRNSAPRLDIGRRLS